MKYFKHTCKSTLEQRLARKFQQLSNGQACAVCGQIAHCEHHIIRRHQSELLRYDWRNGLHLCRECHNRIHNGEIPEPVAPKHKELLQFIATINFKDILRERGITAEEYYREKERELDEQLSDLDIQYVRISNGYVYQGPDIPF
ncbi:MAG: hypothetical protein LBJ18_03760 [Rickettsiales bacterium]|jgi:hypothetical protein|nr:hypothetical protein [Rickettsiales bacterium]